MGEWGHGCGCVVVVDVLWLLMTVVVVVVVWSSWTHRGWGRCGHMLIGVIVVVTRLVGVIVVVMGRVLILVCHCFWWAMGGRCQSCDRRWGQNSPMMVTMHAVITI